MKEGVQARVQPSPKEIMTLRSYLTERKETILRQWIDQILGTYAPETATLFGNNKNQFGNPVGHAIEEVTTVLFDELLQENFSDRLKPSLETIVKIRAVQDFTPSKAVGIIFLLKEIIHRQLHDEVAKGGLFAEQRAIEARIDQMAFVAFDLYMWSREKIYEIRAKEMERRNHMILRRANKECGCQGPEPDLPKTNIISLHEAR